MAHQHGASGQPPNDGPPPGYGSPPPRKAKKGPKFWIFVVGLPLVLLAGGTAAVIAVDGTATSAQLDTIGTSGCKILATDDGLLHLIKVLTDSGLSGRDAGKIGPYIVGRFCPEQLGSLPKV